MEVKWIQQLLPLPGIRIQGGFILSDRYQKETTDRDRFQRADSEAHDSRDGRRIREPLALIEQLSWRTYLKDKSRPNH
jgi:hypothetical protein